MLFAVRHGINNFLEDFGRKAVVLQETVVKKLMDNKSLLLLFLGLGFRIGNSMVKETKVFVLKKKSVLITTNHDYDT